MATILPAFEHPSTLGLDETDTSITVSVALQEKEKDLADVFDPELVKTVIHEAELICMAAADRIHSSSHKSQEQLFDEGIIRKPVGYEYMNESARELFLEDEKRRIEEESQNRIPDENDAESFGVIGYNADQATVVFKALCIMTHGGSRSLEATDALLRADPEVFRQAEEADILDPEAVQSVALLQERLLSRTHSPSLVA